MLKISEGANPNYLAKIVELRGLEKHPNADRLQVCKIDFQNVITGPDAKDGDICVFFPLECQIDAEYLSHTNSFSSELLNKDANTKGFFDKSGRVKAVKLRGEKSMGYIAPISTFQGLLNDPVAEFSKHIGEEFDTINDHLLCKKYCVPVKNSGTPNRLGKKPRISRLVDGQVHLHVDTENLRKMAYKLNPDDHIAISYKVHGTSFWVSNVLVNRKLNFFNKILKRLGVKIQDTEYDIVFGSRRVVKNEYETQGTMDYYDGDLWSEIKDEIKDRIPKGFTIYGECVGFTKGGGFIQAGYDYGCAEGTRKIYVYRITFTNVDGKVFNLSNEQCREFCGASGLDFVTEFFNGNAKGIADPAQTQKWHASFIYNLEQEYTEKDCFICKEKVPEEGIVVRKESLFNFEAYKLKSFAFLEYETKMLDSGDGDIESDN
jgi:RNA ligase (TIGR02306 family)